MSGEDILRDGWCLNCGHPKVLYDQEMAEHGWVLQECWVEDFTDEGYSTAVKLHHRFPEEPQP